MHRSSIIPGERISHILSMFEKFKYNKLSINSADIYIDGHKETKAKLNGHAYKRVI